MIHLMSLIERYDDTRIPIHTRNNIATRRSHNTNTKIMIRSIEDINDEPLVKEYTVNDYIHMNIYVYEI